ncbi:hypothetical protein TWF506_000064 [Arthrobotrys conoides]|uniref:Uncharacterized protein n=1 Tax=Arthrobotrys conoides TaxID=74498 RepID=A0AAN8RX95_9PEZI
MNQTPNKYLNNESKQTKESKQTPNSSSKQDPNLSLGQDKAPNSNQMHWQACLDPQYFEDNCYRKFLYKLYGIDSAVKLPKNLSANFENSLLVDEDGHLRKSCVFNSLPPQKKPPKSGVKEEPLEISVMESLRIPFSLNHIEVGSKVGKTILNPLAPENVKDYVTKDKPFSTGDATEKYNTAQWSYLEVAYRIRMLWQQLWHYAGITKLESNDDSTYLHQFFDKQISGKGNEGWPFIDEIFPPAFVQVLKTNQQRVNQKLTNILANLDDEINKIEMERNQIRGLQKGIETALADLRQPGQESAQNSKKMNQLKDDLQEAAKNLAKLDPIKINLLQQKCAKLVWTPAEPLFGKDDDSLGIAIPWIGTLLGGQNGPAGPMSLEVSFIIALQVQGIDLARVRAYRRSISELQGFERDIGKTTGEKLICTAIKVYGEYDQILIEHPSELGDTTSKKLPPNGPPGRIFLKNTTAKKHKDLDAIVDTHTTVFSSENTGLEEGLKRTGSVGIYCGMDLLEGIDGVFSDVKSETACAGFVIHPTDMATVQVYFMESLIGSNNKQSQDGDYLWYRFNHPAKLPSVNGEYQTFTDIADFTKGNKVPHSSFCVADSRGRAKNKTKSYPERPNPEWYKNRRVRSHAHPVIWSRGNFDQTFRNKIPIPELRLGGYNSDYSMHLYILSEVDGTKCPRQTFIKSEEAVEGFGYGLVKL